jgi:hypothetical protein
MALGFWLLAWVKSGTEEMKVPLVPTAATFELRIPLKETPEARLVEEKSLVTGVRDVRLARLLLVMLETSKIEIEPGALTPVGLVVLFELNSPSFTTMSFDPSGEKETLSGWYPTSIVPKEVPEERLKKPTLPSVVVLAVGIKEATPNPLAELIATLLRALMFALIPKDDEKSIAPTPTALEGFERSKILIW